MDRNDFYWLVGLLEGEGCFGITNRKQGKYKFPRITLNMTDEDVVARSGKLVGAKHCRVKNKGGKDTFQWKVEGGRAILMMRKMRSILSRRRQERIAKIEADLDHPYLQKLKRLGRI